MRFIRKLLGIQPFGYTLIREDGVRHNCIRGDLIPVDALVIIEDGRRFVRADETDDEFGFEVYREGHRTFEYVSINADISPAARLKVVS